MKKKKKATAITTTKKETKKEPKKSFWRTKLIWAFSTGDKGNILSTKLFHNESFDYLLLVNWVKLLSFWLEILCQNDPTNVEFVYFF